MMRKLAIYFVLILISCLDPYPAKDSDVPRKVLVVDGFIDANTLRASVRLSRLVNLTYDSAHVPQMANNVHVEDQDGKQYRLTANSYGDYAVDIPDLDYEKKYKLVIAVSNDERYESDMIDVIKTPPIDSLQWEAENDGVNIYANAHGSTSETPYYQWDFEETWVYTAPLESTIKLIGGIPYHRTSLDNIFVCWKTVPSGRTNIFATTSLSGNLVSRRLVQHIPVGSQKVSIRYSILVKQRAISKAEHEYLRLLSATTENLGGLFDPLPSQTPSNIRPIGSNPGPVGFFSGSSTEMKRIFISFYDLPQELRVRQFHDCVPDTTSIAQMAPTDLIIVETDAGVVKTGYQCADCRAQGGTLEKPDFWP